MFSGSKEIKFFFFIKRALCNFLVWTLKCPQNMKKLPSKVAHNRPRLFYFTVQPRPQPTAQNQFVILWNLGTRHLFSYLWSCLDQHTNNVFFHITWNRLEFPTRLNFLPLAIFSCVNFRIYNNQSILETLLITGVLILVTFQQPIPKLRILNFHEFYPIRNQT